MILTILGWLAGLACAAVAVPLAVRSLLNPRWRADAGNWTAVLLYACGAVIGFDAAGLLSLLTAVLAAAAIMAALVAVVKPWREGAVPRLRLAAASGKDWLVKDTLGARDRLRGGGPDEPEASSPEAAVAEAAATRAIPSVLEDPALGVAPEPAELVAGHAQAPGPYAALAQYIAGFEPEDDMSLRMFMEGNAAGSVMVADAWHHFADTCLNSVGLDPAYVAGILEAGDSAGGHGSLLAQVHKRFGVIYAAVKEWISAHGPLPHKARDFLTGE